MSAPYDRKAAAEIEEGAARDFRNHHIVNKGDNRWLWVNRDPDLACFYWCHIAVVGRAVVLTGDCGDLVIERGPDTLAWLCGVTNRGNYDDGTPIGISYAYVHEKASRDCKTTSFQHVFVERYVEDLRDRRAQIFLDDADAADTDADVVAIDEAIEEFDGATDIGSAGEFYSRLAALDIEEDEPPGVEGVSRHFMWQVNALRFFCAALMAQDEAAADSLDCAGL